jgi:ABC-2 type transport system ATP-binding protein
VDVPPPRRAVIRALGLRKAYGRHVAVSDATFDVLEGEIFGLVGPNGAGKTTTLECLEGVRQADAGDLTVLGLDPVRDVYRLQPRIGVQLQQAQLQKRVKVWEAAHLWAALYGRPPADADRLLDQLGLAEKRQAWFMTLSGGQQQRLFIALALVNDPDVVFFDELTTGLDPQARRTIWELVRGVRHRGKTVFLTTHLMEEAERLCDRVAIMDRGKVIDVDTPAALVARHCPDRTVVVATPAPNAAERFAAVPGVVRVTRDDGRYRIEGRGDGLTTAVIQAISSAGLPVTDFHVSTPTLEDVFLALTGHSIRD